MQNTSHINRPGWYQLPNRIFLNKFLGITAFALFTLLLISPSKAHSSNMMIESCPDGMVGDGSQGDPCQITDRAQLEAMADGLNLHYELMDNIDLSDDEWTPIGDSTNPFTGSFDGNSHTIANLTIDRPSTDYVGLFGQTNDAVISNLKLFDIDVNGQKRVGGLIGYAKDTSISQISSSGSVTSTIDSGDSQVGGIVGYLIDKSSITHSYSSVNVKGSADEVGGLLGYLRNGSLENVYATGTVDGDNRVGGLVGGVLVNGGGTIDKSYAIGEVQGSGSDVGGLIGGLFGTGTNNLDITSSYWDTQSTGQATSTGGTGLTTTQMYVSSNFTDAGWDFEGV